MLIVTNDKKEEVWRWFTGLPKSVRPPQLYDKRLAKAKQVVFDSEAFWFNVVVVYNLLDMTPEQLAVTDGAGYLHCTNEFFLGVFAICQLNRL